MKKAIAILLILAMTLSLVACGETASGGGNAAVQGGNIVTNYDSADVTAEKETEHYEILVVYRTFTDKLGSQYKASLDYVAEAMNVTFTYLEAETDETGNAAYEAALLNKPDAVITNFPTLYHIDAADKAGGIPIVAVGGIPSDDELEEICAHNNYLGNIAADDYASGFQGGEYLYKSGARNVLLCGVTLGLAKTQDARAQGFLDSVATHEEMNLIGEDYSYVLFDDAVISYAASYPEMDGVFEAVVPESMYTTFETEGLVDRVKLAGVDIGEGTGDAFKQGYMVYMAGGNFITNQLGFLVLYNYLTDGTRIIETPAETIQLAPINIGSYEDFEDYVKYFDSGIPPYTAQELLDMVHYFNEDYTAGDFKQLCADYSLEDVKARHAELFD